MEVGNVPLTASELKHLESVIVELEKKTSGEIRLMIVRRSVFSSHLRYTFFGWIVALALLFMWVERHELIWLADWWWVPVVFVGAAVASWMMARIPFFIRLFTPVRDLRNEVLARAELEFYREGLSATTGATGILLFVSMLERQAVVLADKGISSKLKQDIWGEVVRSMLEGPKTNKWAASLEKALRQCGEVLAQHFPIQSGDRNELSNTVIIKD